MKKQLFLFIFILVLLPFVGSAQYKTFHLDTMWVKDYNRATMTIPMRDGANLSAIVYSLKSHKNKHAIILTGTPDRFDSMGEEDWIDGIIASINHLGGAECIVAIVKLREGEKQRGLDYEDAKNWLIKHIPNNDGNVRNPPM